ncbi:MAG: hypothetical protein EOP34_00205 [Rickettsiales bacterium]|nr:MAG: hypothetical protein EOP34_00205 [Rickettsiales bacterium]
MRIVLSTSILFLLLSNAVTARRDKSILYSRTTINLLAIISFIVFETLEITSLSNGIGLFGGLFSTNQTSTTFNFLIFGLTLVILHLTGFYPRKV